MRIGFCFISARIMRPPDPTPQNRHKTVCRANMPLFICRKLGTSKTDCRDKIWKKPCLFTFSSRK